VYAPEVLLFGLTGGIASGKSAVGARLRARAVPVIDADVIAREVVEPGTDGLAALIDWFGYEVLAPGGGLDRKRLAAIVFADPAARRDLERILHPRIAARTAALAEQLRARGEPLACYEAALLVENGLADAFRPLVVVSAPEELQIARAAARDGSTTEEARARVKAQMPLSEKVRLADHVLENTGSLAELAAGTDRMLDQICAAHGVDASRYAPPRVNPG
jgi:dephospho-CoA kinase